MAVDDVDKFGALVTLQESVFYAVTGCIVVPFCLASLCCCLFFCKNWYEYQFDEDEPPMPIGHKVRESDHHAKLGKKSRMGLGAQVKYMVKYSWFMLGDFCQALIFLGMALWFFIITLLNCFPGKFGTPMWANYVLIIILVLVIVGGLCKLAHAYFEAHLHERLSAVHDSVNNHIEDIRESLAPIRRIEKPMMNFIDSVEKKLATVEEALAGQLKKAKEEAEKAYEMAEDGLKIVSNFAEEELEQANELGKKYCPNCGCTRL